MIVDMTLSALHNLWGVYFFIKILKKFNFLLYIIRPLSYNTIIKINKAERRGGHYVKNQIRKP